MYRSVSVFIEHPNSQENQMMDVKPMVGSNKMKIQWTREAVLELIKLWRACEPLYNPKHTCYHNKHFRSTAMAEIATELEKFIPEVTENDVKVKINNLRSQYNKEIWKVKRSSCGGKGTDEIYEPSAYWFSEVNFLKDYVHVGKNTYTYNYPPDTSDTNSSLEFNDDTEGQSMPNTKKQRLDASDVISKAGDAFLALLNSRKPEEDKQAADLNEQDAALINYLKCNLGDIKDESLKDDMHQEIMNVVFSYKKKQRNLTQ